MDYWYRHMALASSIPFKPGLWSNYRDMTKPVAIGLKIGKFGAGHKGQMEPFLRWPEKHENIEGEARAIGPVLTPKETMDKPSCPDLTNPTPRFPNIPGTIGPKIL